MKIQVNSDKSIAGHAELTTFVEDEVSRILRRFAARLTRVEVHLSDVDSTKSGPADKRCLIEVRPSGGQPRTVSAQATKVAAAVDEAANKMKRALTAYFGRIDGSAAVSTPAPAARKPRSKKSPPKKVMSAKAEAIKPAHSPRKRAAAKKHALAQLTPEPIVEHFTDPVAEPPGHDVHSRKEKGIYQGRREAWPTR